MEKHELVLERTYNAPLAQVWSAWTQPELLKQWWGPQNVSITECAVDLRVGGIFSITMEAGEAMGPYKGTLWPMSATFTVVEPQSRLAYSATAWTEGKKEETTIETTNDITFTEVDGMTTVKIVAAIHNAGPMAGMAVQGMQAGFNQQMDKLTDFLGAAK